MDAVDAVLGTVRAQRAFLLRSVFSGDWGLRIEDEAPLTLVAVIDGHAFLHVDGAAPVRMAAGAIALVRGPGHYSVSSSPTRRPPIRILPGQRCVTVRGEPLHERMALGVRTWGNDSEGSTVLLTGTYPDATILGARTIAALPASVVIGATTWSNPVLDVLAAEVVQDQPGQAVVLDRLLDTLTVMAIRHWAAGDDAPAWCRTVPDPCVARALELIHHSPEQQWELRSLAGEVGLSRAAFARRFHHEVGQSPIAYLAGWRLSMAADLLRASDRSVSTIAADVGYASPFTFSHAFKRHFGTSPAEFRATA